MDTSAAGATVTGKERDLERLLREAKTLPLKQRLHLLEALRSGAIVERGDGLRLAVESLPEYKRATRPKAANEPLEKWIGSFGAADVFFDVGANTGSLSLFAAREHHGRVPVYAFEPAFDNFGALVRNVLVNDLSRVITPLHVALFDETGIRPLHRSSLGAGSALHAVGEALDYARRPFTPAAIEQVLAFRLDDLVRGFGLPPPTRIKLDVDGFEDKVLAGGTDVLSSTRCDVYTELVEAGLGDSHPGEVMTFLRGLGYDLIQLVEHGPPGTYPRIVDALFTHP